MNIIGIIAEYNPFHKGHAYHIQKTREELDADQVIVVMSGDFVQRGTPALCSKHIRARMALCGGADLVLELPVCYASASAEFFSRGAISLLDSLGVVTHLSFGSEAGTASLFEEIVPLLLEEPPIYRQALKQSLREGSPFPKARMEAILHCASAGLLRKMPARAELASFLSSPNNILGMEYYKALFHSHSKIKPFTITRTGSGYHDLSLENGFASASAIRSALQTDSSPVSALLPEESFSLLKKEVSANALVWPEDFSLLLQYALLGETFESLLQYQDVSEELARRIIRCRNAYTSFPQFCQLLKTKELTYTRIQRALLHILLRIPSSPLAPAPYARILGMRASAGPLIRKIRETSTIPILSKVAQQEKELDSQAKNCLSQDVFAANLYESIRSHKSSSHFLHDYQKPMVIL